MQSRCSSSRPPIRAADRAAHRRPLIHATRDSLLGTRSSGGLASPRPSLLSEDDEACWAPPRSRWSYACSKAMDEFLALAYAKELALPVIIIRFFNTVGPRQSGRYGMVVPRFVRQALLGEPLAVFGDGTQSRCFTDVSDTVRAIVGLSTRPALLGRVFNVATPRRSPSQGWLSVPWPTPAAPPRSSTCPTTRPTRPASKTCTGGCLTSAASAD